MRLSEIFSSIEIEEGQSNQNNNNNINNNNNNLLEVNPSPIVIHRNLHQTRDHMESTKLVTTILSSTKNTNSLTQVTDDSDTDHRNNDTSRFEYTVLNSNANVHINENNQYVILATQYPAPNLSTPLTDDEYEADDTAAATAVSDAVDLTKVSTFNSKSSKSSKSSLVLVDKTNSLLSRANKSGKNLPKTNVNRYSYCSEVDIEEVIIPESNTRIVDDSDDDDDENSNSNYNSKVNGEKLAINSKQNKSNKNIKDRTQFGSTQSPVVISKSSFFFSKSIKQTGFNETAGSGSTNPGSSSSSSNNNSVARRTMSITSSTKTSITQEQSIATGAAASTNPSSSSSSTTNNRTNNYVPTQPPGIRIIELTLDSSSSSSSNDTNTNRMRPVQLIQTDQTRKVITTKKSKF